MSAEGRIRGYIRETPLDFSFYLSSISHASVYLKLENLQLSGSFKFRGAMSKLLAMQPEERARGVIAASTGNHGLAVAHGMRKLGIKGTICLPENCAAQKVEMLKRYGVPLTFYGDDCAVTEVYARKKAEESGLAFISPYNDREVVAGQGTIGVELCRQLESLNDVFICVGGGGMITGVAGYLKAVNEEIRIIGCQPENSAVMYESLQAGHIVAAKSLPTLSDGSAGGIEAGSITFPLCQKYVDQWILVSEGEIREGMKLLFEQHRLVVEGAAAVSVASFLRQVECYREKAGSRVAIVICGGNVDVSEFKRAVC